LSEIWLPTGPGTHTLTVRAFDASLKSGQATVVVSAIDAPEPAIEVYQVQEGDTLADVAGRYGLAPEDLTGANPGLTEPLSPGETISLPPPPEDPEGTPPEEPPAEAIPGESPPEPLPPWRPSLVDLALRPFATLARGRFIEIEALSLEVDKAYDGVYCYLSLNGSPMERIPSDGYLEAMSENRWGIEDWAAGARRRVVPLADDASTFDLEANCLGYRSSSSGGDVFDLGTMTARHAETDWDGRDLEQTAAGEAGWFRVSYRIHPPIRPEPPLPTPAPGEGPYMPQPLLYKECSRRFAGPAVSVVDSGTVLPPTWFVTCELGIDYAGAAEGFLLLRDGAILRDVPTGRWEVAITLTGWQPTSQLATIVEADGTAHPLWPDTGDLPPPGESYEFQVIAYVGDPLLDPPGGYRSPPSNIVEIGSDIWAAGRNVRLTLHEFDTGCIHADEFGGGLDTWGIGPGEVDEEGHPTLPYGCDDDLDEWGTTTGGVSVNGDRIFSVDHYIHSARRYPLDRTFYFYEPSIELYLGPSDPLIISMRLYDHDVWSGPEGYCHGDVQYYADELESIQTGPGARLVLGEGFASYYGACYLTYTIAVVP
jgi:LysM repeat protein